MRSGLALNRRWLNRTGLYLAIMTAVAPLSACWRAPTRLAAPRKPVEGGVKFSKVVLAQANSQGKLLWKFQAQGVTYGEGQQLARAQTLRGQLFEAGRLLFDLTAEKGTIRQTNQQVRLQGNIEVTDRQHGVVFRGQEVLWNGETGQLSVQKGLTVTHPKVQLWGNELLASKQGREVRIKNNVTVETRSEQSGVHRIRLRANQVLWRVDQQTLTAGTQGVNTQPSVEIEQLKTVEKTTALAGEAQANLQTSLITLLSPARIQVGNLALTSRTLVWDTRAQKLVANELLEMIDPVRQISILASRGTLEQTRNRVDLTGNVEVQGLHNHSALKAEQLLWDTQTQRIEANGNVSYAQASPKLTLRGPKAVGKMTDQTLRVSGGDVVTEIIP